MDEEYLLAAARYVELNPVRARLVGSVRQYRWSSARAHLRGEDDSLVRVKPLLELVPDWRALLQSGLPDETAAKLRQHERTGRPLGADRFIRRLEKRLRRTLRRKKPGPEPRTASEKN